MQRAARWPSSGGTTDPDSRSGSSGARGGWTPATSDCPGARGESARGVIGLVMTRWTPQHVAALAPDASSLAAARRLARPGPWSDTGSTDTLVWGKCQGSGATPYRVSVDVTGPDFRCSCPSRKLPCKHGLALLMLWATGSGSVSEAAEPAGHAAQWAAERSKRAGAVASLRAARGPGPQRHRRRALPAVHLVGHDGGPARRRPAARSRGPGALDGTRPASSSCSASTRSDRACSNCSTSSEVGTSASSPAHSTARASRSSACR